jgi:hypothetical protein
MRGKARARVKHNKLMWIKIWEEPEKPHKEEGTNKGLMKTRQYVNPPYYTR